MSDMRAAQKMPSVSGITDVAGGTVGTPNPNMTLQPGLKFSANGSGQPLPSFNTDVEDAGNTKNKNS